MRDKKRKELALMEEAYSKVNEMSVSPAISNPQTMSVEVPVPAEDESCGCHENDPSEIDMAGRDLLKAQEYAAKLSEMVQQLPGLDGWVASKITKASDGLLVARGDLGVEIGIEQLPAAQRFLIRKAISFDKLAIVATQMMESMITNRVPTRAEVFDVANAVTSGVDAIMFSAETAIGKYPSDVISEASRICAESEGAYIRPLSVDRVVPKTLPVEQVIALSAVYSAKLTKVVAIAALTETGSTALWMSRVQSNIPIYAMTQNLKTARRICLYKGVQSIKLDRLEENHAQANMQVIGLMKKIGTVKKGDLVIITKGDLLGTSGGTNAMKVVEVGNMLEINE